MSTPADSAEATKPPDSPTTPGTLGTRSPAPPAGDSMGSSIGFTATLVVLVGLALFGRRIFAGLFTDDGVRTWATMFVGVTVQAMPFLVLGVLLSAALTALVPASFFANAAQRQSPVAAKPIAPKGHSWLAESAQGDTPVPLAVRDYAVWAVWEKESMKGRNFQLTGFVTPGKNGTWYVSRIGLTCCVADGTAFMVEVRGQVAPPKNQWVTVTGGWAEPTKRADGDVAALNITGVRNVTPPANQYE
ncbi:hypothetical protein ACFPJ1_01020 [Kribbella qitaiheensis]|uniref:TIGR03943 family putative permease subunit n=1 Tax=Kribbella qitaiheensis TaxID=1544730 RepID=UPI00360C10A5